jgi:hypothetical protein
MSFTIANAVAEAARMADRPSAAAAMCTKQPAPMPSAAAAPADAPCVVLRPMTYNKSGPGVMLSSRPAMTNKVKSWIPSMP